MTRRHDGDLTRRPALALVAAGLGVLAGAPASAQNYEIAWYTVDAGGVTFLAGGSYVLGGTAGQPDAGGPFAGGTYSLSGGFWGGAGPDVDLSVTVTDTPDPVDVLQTLTYTLHVTNAGPDAASLVTLEHTLPPEAAFDSAGGSGWVCGEAAGVVTCARPSLPVGPAAAVIVEVIAPVTPGTLTSTATVTAAEREASAADNSAEAQTTVAPADLADVSITKSDGGVLAQWNEPLVYTIMVSNAGPAAAPDTDVTDDLPAGLSGVTWTCLASAGASCTASGAGDISDVVSLAPGATVTYTATGTVAYGTPGPIANTATVAGSVADPVPGNNSASTSTTVTDLIFTDGFESGDLAEWSSAQTDGGDLSVHPGAAMAGTGLGLQGLVDDTAGLFVQDDSPTNENRYRARFYLDPTGFDPGEASGARRARLFIAFEEGPTRRVMAVVLRRVNGQYSVMGRARRDDNSQADTGFFDVTAAPHVIEVDWIRSRAPDANDGQFRLWIDDVLRSTLTGIDSSASAVDFARLGALSVKLTASGAIRWDEFESRRENHIGPLP